MREGVQHVKLNGIGRKPRSRQSKFGVGSSIRNRDSECMRDHSKKDHSRKEEEEVSSDNYTQIEREVQSEHFALSPIENAFVSQFTYNKFILLEKQLFFILITLIFNGFLLVEVEEVAGMEQQEDILLSLMSVITLALGKSGNMQ